MQGRRTNMRHRAERKRKRLKQARKLFTKNLSLCALFFMKFLFFHQMKKFSFHSRDIQIFVIFSLPFNTFQIHKDKWKWNNFF